MRWLALAAPFLLGCSVATGASDPSSDDADGAPADAVYDSSVAPSRDATSDGDRPDATLDDATLDDATAWPPADAGTSPKDSGKPGVPDTSAPPPDTSAPPPDTSTPPPPPPVDAGSPPAKLASNDDPTRVHVYDLNAENLPEPGWARCNGHWQDLLTFMAKNPPVPDVLTVQQLSGRVQAQAFADALYVRFGHPYAFEVALDAPGFEGNACSPYKDHQTNAVFWRTTRFSLIAGSEQTWQAKISATTSCAGTLNTKDRSVAVAVKLKDNLPVGFKYLPVASIHFPQVDTGCMTQNIQDAIARVDGLGGGLRIVAGDVNYRDRTGTTFNAWWNAADAKLYRDVVHGMCGGATACLDDNWTNENTAGSKNRIDFVFAQKNGPARPAVSGVSTITYAQARAAAGDGCGLDYSGHRAIRAFISY